MSRSMSPTQKVGFPHPESGGSQRAGWTRAEIQKTRSCSFEERLNACWGWVITMARRWWSHPQHDRIRSLYDLDDVLAEIWIVLHDKDPIWDPERGKYSTFAGELIVHRLMELHDQASVAHVPNNTSARLLAWNRDRDQHRALDGRQVVVYTSLCRAKSIPLGLDLDLPETRDHSWKPTNLDLPRLKQEIQNGLEYLDQPEAEVLRRSFGVGDSEVPESLGEIARNWTHGPTNVVRLGQLRAVALDKIRHYLQDNQVVADYTNP